MLKFVVLADIHLVPEGKLSHGLDTKERLDQAIAYVNEHHGDAEFVLFAGDLADHGEAEAYERFKSSVTALTVPSHLTLGNHDHRPTFLEVFPEQTPAETGCMDKVIDAGGYRIILLDSSHPGLMGSGRFEPSQLDWLQTQLDEAQDTPVVIVLHHNITPFHVQTDFIILEEKEKFAAIVKTHPDVRQVISGHVHMTTSGTYQGIPFCTFAGAHYSIEPTLESRSGPVPGPVPRREGPGQMAVVLCDEASVVVHMENFLDRHLVMAPDLFGWSSKPE